MGAMGGEAGLLLGEREGEAMVLLREGKGGEEG